MTLSPQWLDELRARTLLSAVVAPSLKLIKAGREFKACCPFHNEKTPSFYVNDEKHFYHCFGCGAHGDAIRFLTDARGLPFMDAVKELAGKAGMEVPAADPKMREKAERSSGLYDVMEAAQRWFIEQLDGIQGSEARKYLDRRGISDATRKRFGFGFAPDSRGKLKSALESFGIEKLVEAGLLIQPDDGKKEPYDRFRGRLTYPIRDARGRVIAFSARILGEGEPKYLNSPDTPLFDKGRTLFNLDFAGPASRKAGRILIVEGQMDVIALDQAGIGEVVAPLGTALTDHQLERLWRLEPAPICCFDGDAAGQKAAVRAALRALPHLSPDRTLRFVALPAGEDPDDVVRSGGKAAFEALIELAEPLVDRLWRAEVESAPLDTPEARAGLRKRLLEHCQAIADPNVRQLYRDEWLGRFDAQFRPAQTQQHRPFVPRGEWKRGKFTPPIPPVGREARAISQIGIAPAMAAAVVAGCVRHPSVLHDHVEQIALFRIDDPALRRLRDFLVDFALSHPALDSALLETTLAASEHQPLVAKLLRPDRTSFSFNQKDADPTRAFREFEGVLMMLVDKGLLENAFDQATNELKAEITDERLARQAHLRAAILDVDNRLASLASSD